MHARILFVVWMLSEFRRWASCQNNDHFSGINYARKKHAYQEPSTFPPYTAERGVDGVTSWDACTSTYGPYNLPSNWTVELGMWIRVTGIIIYNRGVLNFRLQNFVIHGITPLAKYMIYNDSNYNTYNQNVIRLEMSQLRAYTAIQIGIPARDKPLDQDLPNVLTLCEVQVYGVPGCESPNLDSHVQIVSRPNESSIILTCESGYTPIENITLTCNDGSIWSGSQPKCSPIKCESPGEVDNGYYVVSNETMCDSHNITYLHYQCNIKTICNEGYYLRGQWERTCQADGKWTNVYPICDIVTCDFPGEISRGKYILGTSDYIPYVYGPMNYLTKIEVRCDTGYKIENSKERICESSGIWSGSDPQCSIVQCSSKKLETIANGHYILNGESEFDADFANYNDTVGVVCIQGFKQDSDNLGTCGANGTWSNQPSSCTVVTCSTPIETSYVKYQTWYNTSYGIFTNELPYGASIYATCKQGILKAGSRIRYCQENGSWDGENPVCVSLCYAPEVSNGILKDDNNTLNDIYEEGQYLSLTCLEGYTSSHDGGNFTCQKDHSWSYLPSCLSKPNPPTELGNVEDRATDTSLTLQWRTGYDGGSKQTFVLQYRQKGKAIWSKVNLPDDTNTTNAVVDYTINGLASGTSFEVILYSSNTYGKSEMTQIVEATTAENVCNTKENQAAIIGAAVGGMLGGALVVCCITAVVVFFQRLRNKKVKESSKPRNSPTDVPASTYMELRPGQELTSPTSVYSTLDLSGDTRGNTTEEDDKYVNVELGKERTNNK